MTTTYRLIIFNNKFREIDTVIYDDDKSKLLDIANHINEDTHYFQLGKIPVVTDY